MTPPPEPPPSCQDHVPVHDPGRQVAAMATELEAAAQRVMRSGWYVDGAEVGAFEREFRSYCGQNHCIAVANGTDALELALRAVGCRAGHEVVTVANAGMYATTACLQVGATPVFADIDPDTLLISPASVAKALSPQTIAVVVTHLYGKVADVPAVAEVLAGRRVAILEDCAQAHGARVSGRLAGTLGDIAAFSFYPTKNLGALGDGGAVLTGRSDLAERVRLLRQYGWERRFVSRVPYGRNSRMDELQASFLRAKLPKLDAWNARRRSVVERYRGARARGRRGTSSMNPLQIRPRTCASPGTLTGKRPALDWLTWGSPQRSTTLWLIIGRRHCVAYRGGPWTYQLRSGCRMRS